uniref:Uncharacterized protein n=1 Tax=Panagrolaimus sp. PS1159 TaxID=55785 RepID=A0AC35FBX7_9BILA
MEYKFYIQSKYGEIDNVLDEMIEKMESMKLTNDELNKALTNLTKEKEQLSQETGVLLLLRFLLYDFY